MKLQSFLSARFSEVFLFVLFSLALPLVAAAQGKIAFSSSQNGNYDIFVMNPDGTDQVALTSNAGANRLPSFSSGGARIVFSSTRDAPIAPEIYVMNSNGTGQTRLTNDPSSDDDPAFSPDDSKIVFESNRDGNWEIYVMNADGSNPTRLTNFAGIDRGATYSPDGSKIVFVRDDDIWLMNADGSNPLQLTSTPGLDIDPAFSPDGSKITFCSSRDANAGLEIYVMDSDGTDQLRLTTEQFDDRHPVFSPDGSQIAFAGLSGSGYVISIIPTGGGGIQLITNNPGDRDPAWTDATLFPPDISNVAANTSNEGGTITLTGNIFSADPSLPLSMTVNWGDGSQDIFEYPAGTISFSETHQYLDNLFDIPYTVNLTLTTANGSDFETAFVQVNNVAPTLSVTQPLPAVVGSPLTLSGTVTDPGTLDTQEVQITWGDGSPFQSLFLDAGVTNFTANHTYATAGAYTVTVQAGDDDLGVSPLQTFLVGVVPLPTSGKIAFTSNFGGNNNIWLMNSNGTNQVALTTHPASDSYPDLSSDGSKIVFVSDRDGNPEIYTMNAAGAFQTRLTNNAGTDSEPVFSPDGSKIVFASNRDGNHEIYIMNADGSGQTRLTTNTVDDGQAEFSPDGTRIIFSRLAANQSNAHIITMDLNGANPVPLTSGSFVLNGYASYSPNGQKIVFSRADLSHTNPEVYVMDSNGANAVRLTTAAGQDLEAAFSPDGSKIVFRSERDGSAEIYIMDANGANQQRITFDGAGVTNFAPSWSDVSIVNVDIPDDLAREQGATLIVPIIVSDTTGKGILSYDFALNYDPAVLEPLDPAFEKAGTLSANFEVNTGSNTPGKVAVSGFGTNPLSGSGTLLFLRFNVIGTPPTSSDLTLNPFTFNEGIPFVEVSAGRVFVQGTIRGTVTYGTSTETVGVPDVELFAAGSPNSFTTTELDGTYVLGGFGPGSYVVTPSKTGDIPVNAITALDASLISQFLVGQAALTTNQQTAGEVSGNGTLTSFDAALIAQYVVALPNTGRTGEWIFIPQSRSYASVASLIGEDYSAILLGEVSGNWTSTFSPSLSGLTVNARTEARRPPKISVTATLPSITAKRSELLTMPVTLTYSRTVTSIDAYQFDVIYDPTVLQPETQTVETAGTVSNGLSAITNASEPGRLRIAVYGANPINSGGNLLYLRFRVVGNAGSSSVLSFSSLMFNEGDPAAAGKNGVVKVRR